MEIFIWKDLDRSGFCKLDSPKLWSTKKLHRGASVIDEYPGVTYQMNNNFPDDVLLSDNYEVAGQVIVSGKIKAYLIKQLPDHAIEFLNISILDFNSNLASDDYYILHPLGLIDCIDLEKSKVKFNPLHSDKYIMNCSALLFKPDSVPVGVILFRPKYWGSKIMVTKDFAKQLIESEFSGLNFITATGFDGISSEGESMNSSSINIYYEAATVILSFKFLKGESEVSIIDIYGRLIMKEKITSFIKLDNSQFSQGIYFAQIKNGTSHLIKQFEVR